jgi:hypothetical protein
LHRSPRDFQGCRVSTVVVQRFCKPKVGGSNPSPGTNVTNGLCEDSAPATTASAMRVLGQVKYHPHWWSALDRFPCGASASCLLTVRERKCPPLFPSERIAHDPYHFLASDLGRVWASLPVNTPGPPLAHARCTRPLKQGIHFLPPVAGLLRTQVIRGCRQFALTQQLGNAIYAHTYVQRELVAIEPRRPSPSRHNCNHVALPLRAAPMPAG